MTLLIILTASKVKESIDLWYGRHVSVSLPFRGCVRYYSQSPPNSLDLLRHRYRSNRRALPAYSSSRNVLSSAQFADCRMSQSRHHHQRNRRRHVRHRHTRMRPAWATGNIRRPHFRPLIWRVLVQSYRRPGMSGRKQGFQGVSWRAAHLSNTDKRQRNHMKSLQHGCVGSVE